MARTAEFSDRTARSEQELIEQIQDFAYPLSDANDLDSLLERIGDARYVLLFTHWVIYNVPADQRRLDEHVTPEPVLTDGIRQGKNDFGKIGYQGPAPPGEPHHYYFHIYALDCELHVPPGCEKDDLLGAMHNHIVDEGQLMGTFAA